MSLRFYLASRLVSVCASPAKGHLMSSIYNTAFILIVRNGFDLLKRRGEETTQKSRGHSNEGTILEIIAVDTSGVHGDGTAARKRQGADSHDDSTRR